MFRALRPLWSRFFAMADTRFPPLMRASALAALALAGCDGMRDDRWYGYYYPDVMVASAPEMSVPWPDAKACLAGMRAYMDHAPPRAGFACAQGCPAPHDGGFVSDCKAMVR